MGGFVAIVNTEVSCKFGVLVERAEELLKRLPWGGDFEKDTFVKPEFTSLDVLAFCSGSLPLGICLPNYDDVRRDVGFKNVDASGPGIYLFNQTQPWMRQAMSS